MTIVDPVRSEPRSLFGATDTHMHIYEPGFPLNPAVPSHAEPDAGLTDYRREMRALGLGRTVIVQPSAYGMDNRCTLAAMAALGSAARGVAILPEDIGDAEVAHLEAAGMRGLRCLLDIAGGMMDWDSTCRMAPRFAERGWHLDLQFAGREMAERAGTVAALPGSLVIDHLGKLTGVLDPDGPAVAALLRLLDTGRVWVKLSAPYHADRAGPPGYDDVRIVARRIVAHAPERCLWASNWPHPNRSPRPDNAVLFRLLDTWAPDAAIQRAILVDNPAQLYGFDAADGIPPDVSAQPRA
ncbi:MAG: amidohydrolase family protein [Janthinobacterium lividum]